MRRSLKIFVLLISSLFFIFCGCSPNIEGTWYGIFPDSDTNGEYEVQTFAEATESHFIIGGIAYDYTVDENYIIISNDQDLSYTYELKNDEDYGEVLIYNNEICAYKDEDEAKKRAEKMTLENQQKENIKESDDIDELINDLQ